MYRCLRTLALLNQPRLHIRELASGVFPAVCYPRVALLNQPGLHIRELASGVFPAVCYPRVATAAAPTQDTQPPLRAEAGR
jgi:hypothetical protein